MTAMVRKPILMPDELIEVVEAVASQNKVSFAEAARALMAKGASTPSGDATNPFGMDDDVLEGLLTMATDSANTGACGPMSWFQKISDLFKTIVLMDHKITQLVEVVKRLDSENRALSERVAKLEALSNVRALPRSDSD